jgi:hypothetical protein
MAAKKRSRGRSKKKVTIEIDADALRKLLDAAEALVEIASAKIIRTDGGPPRKAKKRAKRRK